MFDFSFANLLHSNLFNFSLMILFFVFLGWKMKLAQKLEDMKFSIQKQVEDSDTKKEDSISELSIIQNDYANIDAELEKIMSNATQTVKALCEKIQNDTSADLQKIETNLEKSISATKNKVLSKIQADAINASIEKATSKIKANFENNADLHRTYIRDFIYSLDNIEV